MIPKPLEKLVLLFYAICDCLINDSIESAGTASDVPNTFNENNSTICRNIQIASVRYQTILLPIAVMAASYLNPHGEDLVPSLPTIKLNRLGFIILSCTISVGIMNMPQDDSLDSTMQVFLYMAFIVSHIMNLPYYTVGINFSDLRQQFLRFCCNKQTQPPTTPGNGILNVNYYEPNDPTGDNPQTSPQDAPSWPNVNTADTGNPQTLSAGNA